MAVPAEYPRGNAPCVVAGMSRRLRFGRGRFRSPKFYGRFSVSGVTRDATGVALAGCTVDLFESATDVKLGTTISDGSGAYSFFLGTNSGFFYVVAYKAGTPDVAGVSANTLTAS